MKKKNNRNSRRSILAGAALQAAGLVAPPIIATAQQANSEAKTEMAAGERAGADFMMDAIKSLRIEYCATNPGTSFHGLHESMINDGGNKNPELLTCLHEESSAAMAHGLNGARLTQTKLTAAAFTAFVRHPPSGKMPPYRAKVMTDQELADVCAHIQTFPAPPPLASVPLLNQ